LPSLRRVKPIWIVTTGWTQTGPLITTQSTKAPPGVSRLGPNLNDLELGNCLAVLLYQARQVNELTANRKALSLAECLTKIEDAARKAQWRLIKLCEEQP